MIDDNIQYEKPYISILTATYNRADLLPTLYRSLIENTKFNQKIEWLIMDDGSTDNTKQVVDSFLQDKYLSIRYFYQRNAGKMAAINKLTSYATGTFMMDVDSDDCLSNDAIFHIRENCFLIPNIYAFLFLKRDLDGKVIGDEFKEPGKSTNIFSLTMEEEIDGERAIVFVSDIRKKYVHKLENGEKFVTEARLYHELDKRYSVFPFNKTLQFCEYRPDGYTMNISEIFEDNPFGYYYYFKELLEFDYTNVSKEKRLYVIKHFILFTYITGKSLDLSTVKNGYMKFLIILLYIPGIITSKKRGYKKVDEKLELESEIQDDSQKEKILEEFYKIAKRKIGEKKDDM